MDKKLLIVEDNKSVAKIHWRIAKDLGLQPTISHSYAQTTELLDSTQDFFCAVIDYSLPDAAEGEAIDYVVEAGIPVIVMTGVTSNEVRDSILRRSVIDYIPKSNKRSYQYMAQLLSQLLRNESIKVLVVDHSVMSRSFISNQLHRHHFLVYEAANGSQALDTLKQNPDIKLMITDHEMPGMSGIALTDTIRQTKSKEELVIIGISEPSEPSLTARFIKNGANDYLHKPFCIEEFNCRLMHNIQYIQNIDTINQQTKKVEQRNRVVEKRNRDIAVLSEIGREITSTLDMEQVLSKIYRHVNALMDAYVFSIGLYRPESESIEFKLDIVGGERLPEYNLSINQSNSLAAWCVLNRKEIVLANSDEDSKYVRAVLDPKSESTAEALIYQPLLVNERQVGCLSVQSLQPDAYSEYHVDMVRTIASYAAIALDNAEAHSKLKDSQNQLLMQEKMASLGTLTAGVAHEINNPTNFVHVSTQNLEVDLQHFQTFLFGLVGEGAEQQILGIFSEKFEQLFKHLLTIKNGTERITGIVHDLQAFTRYDEGEQRRVKLSDCLQSTIKLVQSKYRETAEFIVDSTADLSILCWPAQLNQVLMNLLVNACQAILQKQQTQPLTTGVINVHISDEEEHVIIAIGDNGCGMDREIEAKVFEPFFTTKGVGEGTGLGLSISFGIIQKHRGEIMVESTPGKGTVFSIKLPNKPA